MLRRELSDDDVRIQAEALQRYLAKRDNKGAEFWWASKGLSPADRAAILLALSDLDDSDGRETA